MTFWIAWVAFGLGSVVTIWMMDPVVNHEVDRRRLSDYFRQMPVLTVGYMVFTTLLGPVGLMVKVDEGGHIYFLGKKL